MYRDYSYDRTASNTARNAVPFSNTLESACPIRVSPLISRQTLRVLACTSHILLSRLFYQLACFLFALLRKVILCRAYPGTFCLSFRFIINIIAISVPRSLNSRRAFSNTSSLTAIVNFSPFYC